VKSVILIHSNPQPWAHPTGDYLAGLQGRGRLVTGEALTAPRSATLYRWEAGKALATDGPYAETKEQFAGFFMIDVQDRGRAEAIASRFAGPGETIELRPAMWPGGDA
jgi:hypothetical protein